MEKLDEGDRKASVSEMSDETPEVKLTNKQRAFIEEYLLDFNATRAAREAGYSEKTAYSSGSRLLKDVEVSAEIARRLAERRMSADEVLDRLTDIARGDIGEIMDISGVGFNLDMQKAKDAGKTKLIKKIKQKTTYFSGKDGGDSEQHEIEIELYSAHEALRDLGKVSGLFVERKDITSGGKTIKVTLVGDDNE